MEVALAGRKTTLVLLNVRPRGCEGALAGRKTTLVLLNVRPRGCEGALAGRKTTLVLLKVRPRGCEGALSMRRHTFLPCAFIFLLKEWSHSSNMEETIHAFLLCRHMTGRVVRSMFLQQRGRAAFPMTRVFSKSPQAFTQSMMVIWSLAFFPPLTSEPFTLRVLEGHGIEQSTLIDVYIYIYPRLGLTAAHGCTAPSGGLIYLELPDSPKSGRQ